MSEATSTEPRPPVWVGHISLPVADMARTAEFYVNVGMRSVFAGDVNVLELRGGTHLVLFPGEVEPGADAGFDLMVDDLDATHQDWADRGLTPSTIERGGIHDHFTVVDPEGREITVNSTHVAGPV